MKRMLKYYPIDDNFVIAAFGENSIDLEVANIEAVMFRMPNGKVTLWHRSGPEELMLVCSTGKKDLLTMRDCLPIFDELFQRLSHL